MMFSLLETESSYTYIKYIFCWHKLSLILLETNKAICEKENCSETGFMWKDMNGIIDVVLILLSHYYGT